MKEFCKFSVFFSIFIGSIYFLVNTILDFKLFKNFNSLSESEQLLTKSTFLSNFLTNLIILSAFFLFASFLYCIYKIAFKEKEELNEQIEHKESEDDED